MTWKDLIRATPGVECSRRTLRDTRMLADPELAKSLRLRMAAQSKDRPGGEYYEKLRATATDVG